MHCAVFKEVWTIILTENDKSFQGKMRYGWALFQNLFYILMRFKENLLAFLCFYFKTDN